MRPGFAVTPNFDRAFALGFPYLRCAVPSELSGEEAAARAATLSWNDWALPEEVLRREARLILTQDFRFTPKPGVLKIGAKGKKALGNGRPLTAAEAKQGLGWLFGKGSPRDTAHLASLGFLLEAELGADEVASLLVEALESAPDTRLKDGDAGRAALANRLGFLLLRCKKGTDKKLRTRLRAWLDDRQRLLPAKKLAPRASFEPIHNVLRSVDLAINGDGALERSAFRPGGKLDPASTFFAQDQKLVATAVEKSPNGSLVAPTEARYAFLGGRPALAVLMRRIEKLPKKSAAGFVSTFGFIRSPLVVKWLRSLAAKLPEAKAALELHSA